MNMHLRLIKVIVRAFSRAPKRANVDQACVVSMRVWPMDLDLNLHMNNGRYLSCMDLGRFDLAFSLGLHKPMFKYRWQPLLGSSTIRYRKSLMPFQKFQLVSSIAGWDEKWIFIKQEFQVAGETYALAATKVLFRGSQGNIPTAELLNFTGIDSNPPQMDDWILQWHLADQSLGAYIKFN